MKRLTAGACIAMPTKAMASTRMAPVEIQPAKLRERSICPFAGASTCSSGPVGVVGCVGVVDRTGLAPARLGGDWTVPCTVRGVPAAAARSTSAFVGPLNLIGSVGLLISTSLALRSA